MIELIEEYPKTIVAILLFLVFIITFGHGMSLIVPQKTAEEKGMTMEMQCSSTDANGWQHGGNVTLCQPVPVTPKSVKINKKNERHTFLCESYERSIQILETRIDTPEDIRGKRGSLNKERELYVENCIN